MRIPETMRYAFSIVILAMLVSCGHRSELPLSLYEGIWKMETDEGVNFEEWEKVSDSLLTGIGYTVKDGDTIIHEVLKIKYADGKLCYAPTVQNQNEGQEVLFPLKEFVEAEKKFVFENITHDFPQRIIYYFVNDKNLNVRIEGEVEGKMESADFTYKKQ